MDKKDVVLRHRHDVANRTPDERFRDKHGRSVSHDGCGGYFMTGVMPHDTRPAYVECSLCRFRMPLYRTVMVEDTVE